jgi:site-specific recombinase XerD
MAARSLPYVQRRQLRDGSFRFRGYCQDGDGKRIFGPSFATEQEAYDSALEMRGEARNLSPAEDLDSAVEALVVELRAKRTVGTVRWYQDHLRAVRLLIPGETSLHRITRETIEEFTRQRLREVKAATVNAHLRALHRVFAHAIRRGITRENPVRQVDRPRADAPAMDWFTDAELAALLARITDQRQRDLVLLFALTGIRRSEAARLEPGHVRLQLAQLVVPGKTATRVVPIAPDLDSALRRLVAGAAKGKLLPGGTHEVDDVFRAMRKLLGDRRLHPHALRHTFGTALVRKGVRPDVVMRLMGHRDIKTTLRYVHEVGEDGVQAVGLLQLLPRESDRAAPG